MKRFDPTCCCLFALVHLFWSCHQTSEATPPLPDIMLIMSDDQGWADIRYNGHPYLKTPVLDDDPGKKLFWPKSIRAPRTAIEGSGVWGKIYQQREMFRQRAKITRR